jgi:thiol-disulfide isomerase/thioredoxin
LGSDAQQGARNHFGAESLLSTFVIGLTLGLVWVPCAGPALAFALTLVRDQPGARALLALSAYAVGAALPLLLVGYGGQSMVRSTRWLARYSGRIKQISGVLLVLSSLALQFQVYPRAQTWLADRTGFGDFATRLEAHLFSPAMAAPAQPRAPVPTPADKALPKLADLGPAPEFAGLGRWYNSPPLSLAALRGKVVLVDFWTYSCINCVRTLPFLRQTWSKYHDQPFVIVGVHAPEFVFEKSPANVADAIEHHRLTYPVAQDNDFVTWRAFHNHYWPAKYLIDARGEIRYTHFGEGEDEATDAAIRSLLAELGHSTHQGATLVQAYEAEARISPETYLGARGWSSFANRASAPDARAHRYLAPDRLAEDNFALVGHWQLLDDERQVLRSQTGEIRYHALAGEVNLVLGVEPGAPPVVAEVLVDGKPGKTITVGRHDLYNLFAGPYGEHEVVLKIHGKDLAAYAFTFGA